MTRIDALRAALTKLSAEVTTAEQEKLDKMATADKVPTCECGSRSFNIRSWGITSQSIEFADDAENADDCEWGDDYEGADHGTPYASATCNDCEADVEEILERFGWTFHNDPVARTPTPPSEVH